MTDGERSEEFHSKSLLHRRGWVKKHTHKHAHKKKRKKLVLVTWRNQRATISHPEHLSGLRCSLPPMQELLQAQLLLFPPELPTEQQEQVHVFIWRNRRP